MLSRELIRDLVPPLLLRWVNTVRKSGTWFEAVPQDWEGARRQSSGYDNQSILDAVIVSTQQVVDGTAAYERDSVAFSAPQYSFPVLAAIGRSGFECGRPLSILDIGGALGSSYREARAFFGRSLAVERWHIVEQPSFVAAGRERFETNELRFFDSIQDAVTVSKPDLVLLSSVLQYFKDPIATMSDVVQLEAGYIIVDRTIVNRSSQDRLYVQHVPESIYKATYPCWSLSESKIIQSLSDKFDLEVQFDSIEFPSLNMIDSEFKGYIFKRRRSHDESV